jgi:hypothetical protein
MSAINFPNNPALNEEFTQGEKVYRWNGFRWRAIPASLITIKGQIATQVTGPASAVANQVATFDGTTGKLIKDSGFTIETSVPAGAVFTDTGEVNIIEEVQAEGVALSITSKAVNVTRASLGAASTNTLTSTILTTDTWTDTSGIFTLAKTVNGMLSTDNPIADLKLDTIVDAVANAGLIQTAWANIYRIATSTDGVTFYATALPVFPEDTPVQFKVVR